MESILQQEPWNYEPAMKQSEERKICKDLEKS
jgi:hypothetical protein